MSEKAPKPSETNYAADSTVDFFGDIQAEYDERKAADYRQDRQDHINFGTEGARQRKEEFAALDQAYVSMEDPDKTFGEDSVLGDKRIDERLAEMDANREGVEELDTEACDAAIKGNPILKRLDAKARQIAALEDDPSKDEARQKNEQELYEMMAQVMNGEYQMTSVDSEGRKAILKSKKNAYDHRVFDYIASHTTNAKPSTETSSAGSGATETDSTPSDKETSPVKKRTMKIGERVVELAGAKIPVAYGEEEVPAAKEAPVINLRTPEKPEAPASDDDSEKDKPASPEAATLAPEKSIFETLSDEELQKKIAAVAEIIEGINKDTVDEKSAKVNEYARGQRYLSYIRQLESVGGLSEVDAARLFDEALKKTSPVETAPTDELEDETDDDESSDDSETTPTEADLDDHEAMRKALDDAGELEPPTTRRARRKLRKAKRKQQKLNAKHMAQSWYKTEKAKNERFISNGDVTAKQKEIFNASRDEYLKAKKVDNTLFNRMRYNFGREPK